MLSENIIINAINMVKKIILWGITMCILLYSYNIFSQKRYSVSKEVVFQITNNSDEDKLGKNENKNYDIAKNESRIFGDIGIRDTDKDFSSDNSLENDIENEEIVDTEIEDVEIEDTNIDMPITSKQPPNLLGMDEATAISVCEQNGYGHSIEYYLGGDGTVISQSPKSSENIEPGENIFINIGISQSEFSNRLLVLINEKRTALGLGQLSVSEELNYACSILAQENVNSRDMIRPDGSGWSTVLYEIYFPLSHGLFTTRDNITSLSNANGKIKYSSNGYSEENLLTPDFDIIGMAYSSNNMLVIIVGRALF